MQATEAIDKLSAATCTRTGLVLKLSARAKPPQLESLEKDLSESVANLKAQNRIFGELLTLDKLLDPIEEQENFDTDTLVFEDDMAIIAEVRGREALRKGDIIEVDSDDDDDDIRDSYAFRPPTGVSTPITNGAGNESKCYVSIQVRERIGTDQCIASRITRLVVRSTANTDHLFPPFQIPKASLRDRPT
jgi:hypothetical protein